MTYPRVPPDSARLALAHLHHTMHWRYGEIATAALMSERQLNRIANGSAKFIYRETHDRICAIARTAEQRPVYERNRTSSRTAIAAVRGLAAQGWSQREVARRVGTSVFTINRLAAGVPSTVTREINDRLIRLVREIGSDLGPTKFARTYAMNHAVKRGWKPTMYIDELV